jgi:hypothetical protein
MKKKAEKARRVCLGEGEGIDAATGQMNKHVLDCKSDIEFEKESDHIKFMLNDLGVLTHNEHNRMVFAPGVYYSYNQVEFSPLDRTVSRVFD